MSIMRVFWGLAAVALTPELDALYHKLRTILTGKVLGCGVRWDMAIEMLNAAIKAHASHFVSEAQIRHFIQFQNWA